MIINNLIIFKMVDFKNESIGGGAGYGFGGGSGGGTFLGFLLGAILSRNGGLFSGNGQDGAVGNSTLQYQAGFNAGENGKYRDIVSAQNDINSNITASEIALNQTIRNVADAQFAQVSGVKDTIQNIALGTLGQFNASNALTTAGFAGVSEKLCSLDSKIDNVSYQNALIAKDSQAQLFALESKLSTQAVANQTATTLMFRDAQSREDALKINELQRERDLLATGNFPISRAASITYQDPCAMNSKITNLEQIVIGTGNAVNALLQQGKGNVAA